MEDHDAIDDGVAGEHPDGFEPMGIDAPRPPSRRLLLGAVAMLVAIWGIAFAKVYGDHRDRHLRALSETEEDHTWNGAHEQLTSLAAELARATSSMHELAAFGGDPASWARHSAKLERSASRVASATAVLRAAFVRLELPTEGVDGLADHVATTTPAVQRALEDARRVAATTDDRSARARRLLGDAVVESSDRLDEIVAFAKRQRGEALTLRARTLDVTNSWTRSAYLLLFLVGALASALCVYLLARRVSGITAVPDETAAAVDIVCRQLSLIREDAETAMQLLESVTGSGQDGGDRTANYVGETNSQFAEVMVDDDDGFASADEESALRANNPGW